MKVTGITLWHRRLPLSKPYWLSGGRLKFEALDSTFVRIETDGGLVGWGAVSYTHLTLPTICSV